MIGTCVGEKPGPTATRQPFTVMGKSKNCPNHSTKSVWSSPIFTLTCLQGRMFMICDNSFECDFWDLEIVTLEWTGIDACFVEAMFALGVTVFHTSVCQLLCFLVRVHGQKWWDECLKLQTGGNSNLAEYPVSQHQKPATKSKSSQNVHAGTWLSFPDATHIAQFCVPISPTTVSHTLSKCSFLKCSKLLSWTCKHLA